jgi:UDP-GlcNAc3NAcA epimerase
MNIIHIVGNRPQFVKLGILYKAIAGAGVGRQTIIHTGQHASYAMSDIFFEQFSLPPADFQLAIHATSADQFIADASTAIQVVIAPLTDCIILVYGDTNTTLAGALAASRTGKPLFHFEAGVRTGEMTMPEEINRLLTDRLSQVNYCCTGLNYKNLQQEGYGSVIDCTVLQTGDLMYDAFLQTGIAATPPTSSANYIACTIHRAGNITDPVRLHNIIAALNIIHRQQEVIVPLHPHTAKRIAAFGLEPAFTTMPPLGYLEMKRFLQDAELVITDSGGTAREAYFFKKRSLVVAENPFWPEIIETGAALSCKAGENEIIQTLAQLQAMSASFEQPLFGKGDAAIAICQHLATVTTTHPFIKPIPENR